jgi:hypothetical protein
VTSATGVEELVNSLLYEGYALYPYTPGATKNATPTPFGIVYPPAYAARRATTFDHVRVQCLARPGAGAQLRAKAYFLRPSGERHEASEHAVEVGPQPIGARDSVHFPEGRLTLRSELLGDGRVRVSACVHNTLEHDPGDDRPAALAHSLISTHVVVSISDGRFLSPLESEGCENVNTWPVLATAQDDAVLGAAIVLPDHPQIAPESRGNLFDNTEIEEALVLHVQVLSDAEREAIAGSDPAVRAMIERAEAMTPREILELHGRVELRDPAPAGQLPDAPPRPWDGDLPPAVRYDEEGQVVSGPLAWENPLPAPVFTEPDAAGSPSDLAGELQATVDGVTFRVGEKVVLRPDPDRDPYDRMLHGRAATIERMYFDYDDRLYIGVTVDGQPEQQLLRETGRYLFFFAREVEVIG